jgi:hypothetical protein
MTRLTALMTLLLTAGSATPALACPVCFGASDSLQFKGAQMGILALLAVTVGMLGAFAMFFVYLRRRIRMVEMDQTHAAIQQGAHGGVAR